MGYESKLRINGAYGTLELDGQKVFEVEGVETKMAVSRDDVMISGTNQISTKIKSTKGSGKMTINKVYSRFKGRYFQELKNELDPTFLLRLEVKDPDNGGREAFVITNCFFDGDFDILTFKLGDLLSQEFDFVFTPDDVITQSIITKRS